MARMLNSRFAVPRQLAGAQNARGISRSAGRSRHHCRHCQVDVAPKVDDQGPYCPWCQLNLPSPMEQGTA
jgi:hypothetical protein